MHSERYWLETYGCQMNKAESSALEIALKERGWLPADQAEDADLVILNTCAVRNSAENRIWGRLGELKGVKENRPLALAVMGCMGEEHKELIKERAPWVDMVIGTFQKDAFVGYLESRGPEPTSGELTRSGDYRFGNLHLAGQQYRALVPIMHGCNNFCSYCIVPYVRGRETSRNPDEIFAEIRELDRRGVREITLLGQNVNSYRFPNESRDILFPDLLRSIADLSGGIRWIRFLTSHPKDLSSELIRVLAERKELCRHLHLPVQHGSSRILKAMNRHYDRQSYLDLVGRIRDAVPDISLTTDLIAGFPGETEEDFEETLSLMKAVRFDNAFTYRYNPREGTAAWKLGDTVPDEVKGRRLEQIITLQRELGRERKQLRLGSVATVLVEGISRKNERELLARTEQDDMVVFPGQPPLIGSFAEVTLTGLSGNTFRGIMDSARITA